MGAVGPVHVLVVDDLPASRGLAAIWLSDGLRGGVEVAEAATLAEMRAAWAARRPDVVILDQRLPDGEGLDGARELLAADPDATIILLTGIADPALDQEAERAGVADFLVKHEIDGPMLARTVRYALRRRDDGRRLRRSEERYRNLVKALPDTGVLVVDERLRFVMAAGDALEQAGHNPDALVGQSVEAVLARADRLDFLQHYRAALGGVGAELETVSENGRTYRTAFRPLGAEAMAVTFDITEQLAQAAELQRAQALASTGSWRWDVAVQAMTWSPELCRIYGLDPSEPLPTFLEFLTTRIVPADRDRVMAVTRAAQRDGAEADLEMGILRTDGTQRTLHSRVRPVRGPDGAVVRIEGISQDVTELRATERARQAAEHRFEAIFDHAPTGMFLADREGRLLRVNVALAELTGFSREELLEQGPLDIVHPDDVAQVRAALQTMSAGDVSHDHRLNHRDGHAVWTSVSATLLRDERGEPMYVLGQVQDITARREYEERLRRLADHDPLTPHEAEAAGRDQPLDRAPDEDRLVLHARPIVDLRTRATVRHEILVSMVGDGGEPIPPSAAIDRWVVTEAIRAMGRVAAADGRLALSVNVSAGSSGDAELLETIAAELAGAGVAPADLVVELAETAAVADIPRARAFAEALRALGCGFALGDVGAGLGALSALKLPFDVLKLDDGLVAGAREDATDRLVIAALTGIAHGLGKVTVAELTGDGPAIELLLAHGVELGQGHHLGRAAPLAELLSAAGAPATRPRADTPA
jgi:PAS domain S-box-containing protein